MTRKLSRQLLGIVWVLAVIALLTLAAATHVAGLMDRQLFIVRGASMAPAIPIGALILVGEVAPDRLAVGDVITFRTAEGAIITHRIVELRSSADGQPLLRTQGDASTAADVVLVPASDVIGEVQTYAPYLGFVLAFVSMPSGLVSVLAALGALLVARWSLETHEPRRGPARLAPVAQSSPSR